MFEAYILPVLIFAALGCAAGILLTVVSKLFEVKTDERIQAVNDALPQVNCGACGYSGCADYANAVVINGVATNLCKPGGAKSAEKIAEILGTSVMENVPQTAYVRCSGNCSATKTKMQFEANRPVRRQSVFTAARANAFTAVSVWGTAKGSVPKMPSALRTVLRR